MADNTNKNGQETNAGGTTAGDVFEKYAVGIIDSYVGGFADLYMESMMQTVQMFQSSIDYENEKFMASMDRATQVLENSLTIITDGFAKTANDIGADALKNRMAEAKANIEARKREVIAEKQFNIARRESINTITSRTSEIIGSLSKTNQELYKDVFDLVNSGVEGIDVDTDNKFFDFMGKAAKGLVAGADALASVSSEVVSKSVDIYTKTLDSQMQYDVARLKAEQDLTEKAFAQFESLMQQGEKVVSKFQELYQNVRTNAEKADTAARIQGVQMGFYGKMGNAYARTMVGVAEGVAEKFGKSMEDIMAVQKAYVDEAGRTVQMSARDLNNIFSIGRTFGMGDTEVAQMMGSMNVFNQSVENTSDLMSDMYHSVTKMGLSSAKFGKDLVKNLQLAQKYNFKGGLDNMAKMTQWAQQTRFNLDSAAQMSDKLLNGTISEALEVSAKLQVLGGSAGIYSDPIAMLYEAGADVGMLARRQAAMFNDLMGTFDRKTGETTFSWYENQMIKARAQAAGLDEAEVKNMIRQQNKQQVTDRFLRGGNLTDEERTAISNRATYNSKKGAWEVATVDGKKHNIEEFKTNKALLDMLMPEDRNEAILDVAQKSLGFQEKQTIYQAWLVAHFTNMKYSEILRRSELMLDMTRRHDKEMESVNSQLISKVGNMEVESARQEFASIEANKGNYVSIVEDYNHIMNVVNSIGPKLDDTAKRLHELVETGSNDIDGYISHIKDGLRALGFGNIESTHGSPEDLISAGFKNFNDYANVIGNETFPNIINSGKRLSESFSDMALKIAKDSTDIVVQVAPKIVMENLENAPGYLKNIANVSWELGKAIGGTVAEELNEQFSNIFPRLFGNNQEAEGEDVGVVSANQQNQSSQAAPSNTVGGTTYANSGGTAPSRTVQANTGVITPNTGAVTYMPSQLPLSSIDSNVNSINETVSRIKEMMTSVGGRADISVNNTVEVGNATSDAIKNAIIEAVRNDARFSAELNDALSNKNDRAGRMSGRKSQ